MLEIRINNEPLDIPAGFSVEIEDTNPIFNERGSQSIPATVPASAKNERLLGFPSRIDTGRDPNQPEVIAVVSDGAYIRRGIANVTSAGRAKGITFNVGLDNSTAYSRWSEKKLSELSTLPVIEGEDVGFNNGVSGMLDYLTYLYQRASPGRDPLAVFPVAVGNESIQQDDKERIYWEVLNAPASGIINPPTKVKRIIDGEITEVTVPAGYCSTPFLRVWKVLELIFADLGVTIEHNDFRHDNELNRLVVLNNAADAICTGVLKYHDLMPDCTVSEFMNALWVRFGLVYNINFDTKKASLRLLRDIISDPAAREMVTLTTGPELINYEARQYIKLSAKTSLEGAAPATERFEDFIKGLDIRAVHLGNHVSQWTYVPSGSGGAWDGDVRDDHYWIWEPDDPDYPDPEPPEPDYPEPDDDRDDGRDDYALYSSRAAATPAMQPTDDNPNTFLAREFITGTWYKLDNTNRTVKAASSSFFNWDPATPGMDPLDLSSDDECVPIMRVDTVGLGTGNSFNDKCPAYLTGARHYHSYIKGSEDAEDTGDTTPLAFVIAYTTGGQTIGRINAESDTGKPLTMDDGSTPTLSLLFQFQDGLFVKFWAGYDEILRHGNRSVEVPARIDKLTFFRLDTLSPVMFRGVRCLIDTLSYSLPASTDMPVDLKLRTISTHGEYNIKDEQNVPEFSAATRHLEWFLKSETYSEDLLHVTANKQAAADKYKAATGYTPHGTEGDWWTVNVNSAVPVSIARTGLTWQTDDSKPIPVTHGVRYNRKYKALLTYEIFEIHDLSYYDGPEDWELDEVALGSVSIEVEYSVELVARWVND
ncbi:hypothetical protein [Duncaniella muris]|uniref:hypothetical protein n=1 Tax=Duncaniella muris TaxID=2094150 RepID=UPI00259CD369|nr:hypothetical protein [Duncaniella muris]